MSFAITAAVAGVVIAGASAYSSYKSGKKAASAAEQQASAQAGTEREVTAERLRQIEREKMLMAEETTIRTAGSRIKIGSKSTLEVLADQEAEFTREKSITARVGASAATAALARGSALATQAKYQGASGALSGISTMFSILGSTNWTGK